MVKRILAGVAVLALVAGLLLVGNPANAADPVATVPVTANPRAVAMAPDGTEAYIATGAGKLHVLSLQTNTVTDTIDVGASLAGVALTPDGSRAYVSDTGGQVAVVNIATRSVVTTIAVPGTPYGVTVAPDGRTVYVTQRGSDKVSVISTATNTVTGEMTVGLGPTAIAVSADGSRGVVANGTSNTATVLNLPGGTTAATVPVGAAPYGVAIDPGDGVTAYVTATGAGTVSVIGANNTVSATIPVPGTPVGVTPSTDDQFLYVTRYTEASVAQVRLSNGSIVENTPTGALPIAGAMSPDGSRMVTANFNGASVTVTALAPAVSTSAASPVKGTAATGRGTVTSDADPVTSTRCHFGTDAATVAEGPRGSARSVAAVPATAAANSQTDVTCNMTGLSRGTDYYYVVAATDADGTGWSPEPVMFTTRPAKVAQPQVVRKKKKLRFSWRPTTGAEYYEGRIRRGGSFSAWRSVDNPRITFSGLQRSTAYRVQLRAGNDAGTGPRRTVKTSTR